MILRARKQHERFAQLGKSQEANGLYVIEISLLELEVQLQAIDITNGGSLLREIEAQLLKVENRLDEELDRLEKITTVWILTFYERYRCNANRVTLNKVYS